MGTNPDSEAVSDIMMEKASKLAYLACLVVLDLVVVYQLPTATGSISSLF